MPLKEYKAKRNFRNTPEPAGRSRTASDHLRFVVQRHNASSLHYDFRLELDGVLKSWAVPKGPSMNPADKRLAVHVEDHPIDYISFEGIIPAGNYGAGDVQVWDQGNYIAVNEEMEPLTERQALQAIKKGELKFVLQGSKLSGGFVLVRLHNDEEKNWLLIKHRDEFAVSKKYDSEQFAKKTGVKKAGKSTAKKAVSRKAVKGIAKKTTKGIKKKATKATKK